MFGEFRLGQVEQPAIVRLLAEHLADMYASSPAESVHALDLTALQKPEIRFWSLWLPNDEVVGCVALKQLSTSHAELKSMHTANQYRRQGYGLQLLQHAVTQARELGFNQLSLETGSTDFFAPARQLYETYGFVHCGPFADYTDDPYSVFMTLLLK
jgi:putative acetyltransferase